MKLLAMMLMSLFLLASASAHANQATAAEWKEKVSDEQYRK
jgi:hypothetical protein